jgi:hypothetical protein
MVNDDVGECLGVSGGNVGMCNREKPASEAAKKVISPLSPPSADAIRATDATKPLPSPVAYSGSGTGSSLTCNTFPVYYGNFGGGGSEGMMSGFPRKNDTSNSWNKSASSGSYTSPGSYTNSPAVWNVVQPPSGWNSKYGFMSS